MMKVSELIEKLSKFSGDAKVMVYDDHFEGTEPLDSVESKREWGDTPDGNVYLHFWAG